MKRSSTDFSEHISSFFTQHLPNEKGASPHTIQSYSYCFSLLFKYLSTEKRKNVDKLSIDFLSKTVILGYLDWLEKERKCSANTRNARLAGIKTFFNYLKGKNPKYLDQVLEILSIFQKKIFRKEPVFLTIEGIRLLLAQVKIRSLRDRRDLAILALLYDSAARVQELIDLKPSSLSFKTPTMITIVGKGNKARSIPLNESQVIHLKTYMEKSKLFDQANLNVPLFHNSRGEKFTRAGINCILNKYIKQGREIDRALFPDGLSCHSLRHSKAMHLIDADVDLIYIRDFLGHSSITATEVYARLSTKKKIQVIESASKEIISKFTPETGGELFDSQLMNFVKSFSSRGS